MGKHLDFADSYRQGFPTRSSLRGFLELPILRALARMRGESLELRPV